MELYSWPRSVLRIIPRRTHARHGNEHINGNLSFFSCGTGLPWQRSILKQTKNVYFKCLHQTRRPFAPSRRSQSLKMKESDRTRVCRNTSVRDNVAFTQSAMENGRNCVFVLSVCLQKGNICLDSITLNPSSHVLIARSYYSTVHSKQSTP